MSGGYCSSVGVSGPSRPSRSSRSARTSQCLPKGDVECVSDMLRVLMLVARGRLVISSRYNGLRDGLCRCRQGLCRHNVATACVVDWLSGGCPLLDTPVSVWASWAVCSDNCWCASDLYVNRGNRLVLCIWVSRGWVDFDLVSFVVRLSGCDAMVELMPLATGPHY